MTQTTTKAITKAMTKTTVDILRHGACEGGNILRGRTNSALSKEGWQQMQTTLAGRKGWQQVVSSPLIRCRDFAQEFAQQRQLPLHLAQNWREVDFGCWDGLDPQEIHHREPDNFDLYYREPGAFTPEGGEPLPTAGKRVAAAWDALLNEHGGKHILLICHGGVIRLLLAALQNAPLSACNFFDVPYASLSRIRVHHRGSERFQQLLFHGVSGDGAI